MEKIVTLKDGVEVLFRPVCLSDLDMSEAFFLELPEEDKVFLRTDVTQREFIKKRIMIAEEGTVDRIVALHDNGIVAEGTLELECRRWKSHQGELRLIVARPYQRRGLGYLMARELYTLASKRNVEEIVVRMMRPQEGAQKIFTNLGFKESVRLTNYVKDLRGHKQDLMVMRSDL